jgi:hypothetical protein
MSAHISPTPPLEATSDKELIALSYIYRRAIERYEENQKGGPSTAPDARKEFNGSGRTIISK